MAIRSRKRSGYPAALNSSHASPSSTAESSLVIREPCESARSTRRKRIRIANTATPTIRVPFSRSKENAERIASGISVPATITSPSATTSRMRTSAFRSERRRQIANAPTAPPTTSPTARIAVSSGGKRSARGMATGGRRIGAPLGRNCHFPRTATKIAVSGSGSGPVHPLPSRDPYANPDPGRRRVSGMADRDAPLGSRARRFGRRQLLPAPLAYRELNRLPYADPLAGRPDRGLARGVRKRDPFIRRLHRGPRVPRWRDRRDPARGDRALRRAAVGPLLDALARGRGRDPVHERDRHPQPALRDPRPGSGLPPREARDDGGVRDPQHRH